jgi:ATP-dependent helicase/nuclease subunit B
MKARILAPAADLVGEVAAVLKGSAQDASTALVVFPGKRPSHFLRHRLAAGKGHGFIPPRILSMDELVDDVFERRRGETVRPRLDPLDAVAILHDIQIGAPHPLGGSAFMTLDSFFPVGLKVYRDIEELLLEGVAVRSVAEVQPLVEEEVPPRSRDRLRSLAHFYEAFYQTVAAAGWSTSSSRYREVAASLTDADLIPGGEVIFAGFSSLSAVEKGMLRTASSWDRV